MISSDCIEFESLSLSLSLQDQFIKFLSLKNINLSSSINSSSINNMSTTTSNTINMSTTTSSSINDEIIILLMNMKYKIEQLNLFSLNESLSDLNWNGK